MFSPLPPLGWQFLRQDAELVVGEYLFRPGWVALVAILLALAAWRAGSRALTGELAGALARLCERPRTVALALAGASALASIALALGPLGAHPHTQDEVAYLFQARTFASGRLWVPAPPDGLLGAFQTVFLIGDGARWYGKYPFGWPAALAPFAAAGVEWLANPLANALALMLFFRVLARRWPAGWALGGVALLAASPFFVAMGASLLTHPLALVLVLAVADGVETLPSARGALVAGCAVAALFTVRPLDAVAVAIPAFLIGAVRCRAAGLDAKARAGRAAALLWPVALAALATLAYNALLTGDPLVSPFLKHNPMDRPGFGPGVGTFAPEGHNVFKALMNLAFNMLALNEDAFGWPGITLAIALFGLIAPPAWDPLERLLIACAAALGAAYFTFMGHGIAFGPRYYHAWMPLVVALVMRAGHELCRRTGGEGGDRAPRLALVAAALCAVALATYVPARVEFLKDYWDLLSRPRALLAGVPADADVIVIPAVRINQRELFDSYFDYNGIDPLRARPAFVRDGPWVTDGRIAKAFPGRAIARLPDDAAKKAAGVPLTR